MVNTLFINERIDSMTYKRIKNEGHNPSRIPQFYTLTKIHKPSPVRLAHCLWFRSGPTERISSFVDSLLQPITQKQESYIKDTTHFVNFIENKTFPHKVKLATLDVCSLYTYIPQVRIRTTTMIIISQNETTNLYTNFRGLMTLILQKNSFQFNGKNYLQTHGTAKGTKMAIAFKVIFMAHIEKQLLASPS